MGKWSGLCSRISLRFRKGCLIYTIAHRCKTVRTLKKMEKYIITNSEGNSLEVTELELENHKIRVAWDDAHRTFYFSVVDVVGVLTEQDEHRSAAKYWSVLKVRLQAEGSELPTNCSQLKMMAEDG